jgi:predicted unusual protein kinase regulating ubiquinone biosynthesis (AarF/ABC1/UbiB family)
MAIKLAQTLAGIKNMPSEINKLIQDNTDNVYYSDDEIDYKLLAKITSKYKIILDNFEPINSGMIAVVFSGVNAVGERVIIKMKRNNIRTRIEIGYKSLSNMYNIVYYLAYPFHTFDELLQNVKSFVDSKDYILTQCEFENEIKAMKVIRETVVKYTDDIVIPQCYNEATDNEFIVMEFIDGTNCFEIDKKYKKEACRLIGVFTFLTGYFSEITHSDLHPGNLLIITKDDRVKLGVIDFGMNVVLTDEMKDFSHGTIGFIIETEKDPTKKVDILRSCINMTIPPLKLDTLTSEQYDTLNTQICDIIKAVTRGDLTERQLHLSVAEFRKALKSDNIILSMEIVKYAMGLSMMQSSLRLFVNNDAEIYAICKSAIQEVMRY